MRKQQKQTEEKITALYARLSKDDEREGTSESIENQKIILERYAKENHLPNPRFFADDGYSGVSFTRPAFMEIMDLAEQGKIGTIVTKDYSRLGRNRLIVGQLLEEDFVRLGVRYIAIMENIDTAKGVSDIVPIQDLFNEWHAKNTSDKVKRVMQSKGDSGIPLTTNLPYGYKKSLEDKRHWEIDEPAAEIVQKTFQMCVNGLGPTQIARQLKAEGIPTPSEYLHSRGLNPPTKPPVVPHNWTTSTVVHILERQEYVGDTVNFRSCRRSFKLKQRIDRPQEAWKIFSNTHPPIIGRETFALVQQLRQHRRRPTKSGIVSVFSGLLYCADCGEKLYYSCTNNYKREQAYFFCSSYRRNTQDCTIHYIREKVIEKLVLEGLQRLLWYVQVFEKRFAQEQMERLGLQQKRELAAKRLELEKVKQRVTEIDRLIQKSYEDLSRGLFSEERFAALSLSLENEQRQLKGNIPAMKNALHTSEEGGRDLQSFIDKARKVTRLSELTPEILHEFVEKIVVRSPETVDGKRHQQVDIYYNAIGLWCAPGPDEMEELFQAYWAKKQRKTA